MSKFGNWHWLLRPFFSKLDSQPLIFLTRHWKKQINTFISHSKCQKLDFMFWNVPIKNLKPPLCISKGSIWKFKSIPISFKKMFHFKILTRLFLTCKCLISKIRFPLLRISKCSACKTRILDQCLYVFHISIVFLRVTSFSMKISNVQFKVFKNYISCS